MEQRVGHPIAVRRFGVEGEPARQIVLVIGEPIAPGHPQGEWSSPVLISGMSDEEYFAYVPGIDAIQALQLALQRARQELDASKLPITWLDGEPGDLGLYRPITSLHGLRFQRLLERMHDLVVEAAGNIILEFHKKRAGEKTKKKPE